MSSGCQMCQVCVTCLKCGLSVSNEREIYVVYGKCGQVCVKCLSCV